MRSPRKLVPSSPTALPEALARSQAEVVARLILRRKHGSAHGKSEENLRRRRSRGCGIRTDGMPVYVYETASWWKRRTKADQIMPLCQPFEASEPIDDKTISSIASAMWTCTSQMPMT
jgi:hypothetical protein